MFSFTFDEGNNTDPDSERQPQNADPAKYAYPTGSTTRVGIWFITTSIFLWWGSAFSGLIRTRTIPNFWIRIRSNCHISVIWNGQNARVDFPEWALLCLLLTAGGGECGRFLSQQGHLLPGVVIPERKKERKKERKNIYLSSMRKQHSLNVTYKRVPVTLV